MIQNIKNGKRKLERSQVIEISHAIKNEIDNRLGYYIELPDIENKSNLNQTSILYR